MFQLHDAIQHEPHVEPRHELLQHNIHQQYDGFSSFFDVS